MKRFAAETENTIFVRNMSRNQKDYCAAYKNAERHLKYAEKTIHTLDPTGETELTGGVLRGLLIPSVNELRYAGRHAVSAVEAQDDETREEQWNKAKGHCFRASYDAFDAQLQYIISECVVFQNDFRRGVEIKRVIPEYQEDCRILNRLKNVDYRQTGTPEEHWEEMGKHVATLLPILERWTVARDELNKILKDGLFDRWIKITGTLMLVVTAAAAVVAVILRAL